MRKRLLAAVAIAPLSLIGLQAHAQTTISNTQATQVSTSTTGDLTIASGATLNPTASGAVVTINSNNFVTNNGTIQTKNTDNVVGILVGPGSFTGSILNTSEINLTEDYTPTDNVNGDGVVEAPFAQGTNRIGILTTGLLTGNVVHSGSIDIQGNNSIGISIGNGLIGQVQDTGVINITGDNTIGIRTAGEITGGVQISNAITTKGQNTIGVQTTGKIDGALTFYTTVTTSGFALDSRATTTAALQAIEKTPTDLELSGPSIQIQGSVLGGVLFGAPPLTTVSTDTTTDADGDGIVDSVEGSSVITSSGSAPALQIGAATPITLGQFGTGQNAFGLIIRGNITGQGIYDGFSANAIDIGAGGGGVNISGGIALLGTVAATSYQADAVGMHLESGAVVPSLQMTGTITSSVTSAGANTATTLLIDKGATLTTIDNYGILAAGLTGNNGNATVVADRSGTLTTIENTGTITAGLSPTAAGDTVLGRAIALDLSANTTGVTIRQELNGTTLPSLIGDVLLGSGPNTVQLLSGKLQGSLSMGGAASSLTIDNAATYIGALTYSGSALSVNIANGTLQDNSATKIGASNLTVGGSSTLIVALDPQAGASTQFNVSGAATFASGAKIGATLLSTPIGTQTFTIVKAGSLSVANSDTTLLASLPFLFDGSVHTNTAANTITMTVSTKSATELGLNKAETSAYQAVIAALPQDTGIQTALVSSTTRADFLTSYDQLLPNSGGDVFQTVFNMSKSISRATADRFDLSTQPEEDDAPSTNGTWASEFYTGIEQGKGDNNPFHSAGLGIIGGVDFGGYGATMALASANVTRPHSAGGDSLNSISTVEGGFYMAPRFGPLSLDARVGAGYMIMKDRRQFAATILSGDLSSTTPVSRTAEGDWNGYDLSGHIGAGFQADLSKHLFIEPKIYADFFHTHEDAYNETGGGAGYDFNVSAREGTQTSATASVVTGMKFGTGFIISPQLEIGYDQVVQGGPGNTTARFAYGGPSFTVQPNTVGGAAMARFSLKGDGNYVHFSLQGGGEFRDNYHALDLRAVFRMTY